MDFSSSVILSEIGYELIDNVAGGETAGIPFAAWIADKLMLPMQYIRKKAKGFGRATRRSRAICSKVRGRCWWKTSPRMAVAK